MLYFFITNAIYKYYKNIIVQLIYIYNIDLFNYFIIFYIFNYILL